MNTSRSRPIIRHGQVIRSRANLRRVRPEGSFTGSLHNKEMLQILGEIVTYLPQIEERMIDVLALLMGGRHTPARQVFRSLMSEDARVRVMRSLLEQHRSNRDKGPEFDEIIDLFVEVKKARNSYVHGLWLTHSSGRAYLSEASGDEFASFLSEREVKASEMRAVLKRMTELWFKALAVSYPQHFGPNAKRPPSSDTPPAPPGEPPSDQPHRRSRAKKGRSLLTESSPK